MLGAMGQGSGCLGCGLSRGVVVRGRTVLRLLRLFARSLCYFLRLLDFPAAGPRPSRRLLVLFAHVRRPFDCLLSFLARGLRPFLGFVWSLERVYTVRIFDKLPIQIPQLSSSLL